MKKIFLSALLLAASALTVTADNCELGIMVAPVEQGEQVTEATNNALVSRLISAVTATGVAASDDYNRFLVTGRFTHIYQDVVAGPPMQHVVHTQLTLYVADVENKTVYASQTFELRGVGTSEPRAFTNAMTSLNGKNAELTQFIDRAKEKIINYYDKNYSTILRKADAAASLRNFEEALFYTTSIPECSTGYAKAVSATQRIFKQYIDYNGELLLRAARGAWAAQPDAAGGEKAWEYLMQIDSQSSAFPAAEKLAAEITSTTKDDKRFGTRQKYNDRISLTRSALDAARQVGVAYGNGQKPTTTNLLWVK